MEKRGYVKAGPWTPEVVMEQPEAGKKSFISQRCLALGLGKRPKLSFECIK